MVVTCAVFLLIAPNNYADMGANKYSASFAVFVACALSGSYLVVFVSELICLQSNPIKRLLIWFGKNSLSIVIWQFVAFRIVVVIQMVLTHVPFNGWSWLFDYYPCFSVNHGWWIAYFIVGMLVPIWWTKLLGMGKAGEALKRLHAI